MQFAEEALTQMGMFAFDFLAKSCGYGLTWPKFLASGAVSEAGMRSIAGNAMSLPVLGGALYCLLSSVEVPQDTG